MRSLLPLLIVGMAWAQTPATIFPSDSKDPKQSGGAALLEAVCPGRVIVGKEIGCDGACPKFTDFSMTGWSLAAVTRGHFLSSQSDDAVLSMTGCEPHSYNFGGTILLTRRSQQWIMLWYKGGVDTSQCHKMTLRDRREILVCLGDSGAQGSVETQLYLEDLRAPSRAGMAGTESVFFALTDDTGNCGRSLGDDPRPYPIHHAYIERVDFKGKQAITTFAHWGERNMTAADVEACENERNPTKPHRGISFLPPTKRYKIDFLFDGSTYRVAPGSAAAAQVFK